MGPTILESTQKRLEGTLASVAGHLNALHAQMVRVVVEALQTGAWQGYGIITPEQWLTLHTGLSPERARQIVRIARRSRRGDLPETIRLFDDGLITVDQVAVIARRVPAHNDREAAELAQAASVAQLRRAFSKRFITPADPDADDVAADAGVAADGDAAAGGADDRD